MSTFEKYLNEKKNDIKVGDSVKEKKDGPFGKKEVGKVIKVKQNVGWTVYNVKFSGDKKTYEYHDKEIKKV